MERNKENSRKINITSSSSSEMITKSNCQNSSKISDKNYKSISSDLKPINQSMSDQQATDIYHHNQAPSNQLTMFQQQDTQNNQIYLHDQQQQRQQIMNLNGNSNNNNNNWIGSDCCSQTTSTSINNLNDSNSLSHQNSSSVNGNQQANQQIQYPETTFYYLTRESLLRSMCIRIVSNKYPNHNSTHFGAIC